MKIEKEAYYKELIELTNDFIHTANQLKELSITDLNHKPQPNSWSALECLEHLNLYGDFYLPEIQKRINENKNAPWTHFKTGFLGNRFTDQMKPGPKMKKMNTFNDKNPSKVHSELNADVINRFLNQQTQFLELLTESKKVNLQKTKTSISISKLLKLRLGDTLRFLVYHNQRHIVQARQALPQN